MGHRALGADSTLNPSSAQNPLSPVKHRCLAGSNGGKTLFKTDLIFAVPFGAHQTWNRWCAVAELDFAWNLFFLRRLNPVNGMSDQSFTGEVVFLPHDYPPLILIDFKHVKRLGGRKAQSPSLPNGQPVDSLVVAQHLSRPVDDFPATEIILFS